MGGSVEMAAAAAAAAEESESKTKDLPEMKEMKDGPLDGGEKDAVIVDIKCGSEKMCRICHLTQEGSESSSELVELGCGCKEDLALSHRHCAEAWFKLKGNRTCEICGVVAKNVTGVEEDGFLEEWSESRGGGDGGGAGGVRSRRWTGQPLCNFLMTCLVIAFILPWFFRVNIF